MVGSIQAIPICCHMNLYSPTLTPNFDLPWPLRPLFDLLDNFFQLQNMQLNRFINGTPWYMAKTCATGFQNLGCYAAKTTFYFIEEPIVLWGLINDFRNGCCSTFTICGPRVWKLISIYIRNVRMRTYHINFCVQCHFSATALQGV